jgi:hypothetical protein
VEIREEELLIAIQKVEGFEPFRGGAMPAPVPVTARGTAFTDARPMSARPRHLGAFISFSGELR